MNLRPSTQQMYMKWGLRGLSVAMIPMTMNFAQGIFVYWITTNFYSFAQMQALRLPALKRLAVGPGLTDDSFATSSKSI